MGPYAILCRTILTDFEETMDYGGPSYKRTGEVEVGFASQKHFIDVYTLCVRTDVMNACKHLLTGKGVSFGKGCIRYSKPERIDVGLVEKMLCATQESIGPVC